MMKILTELGNHLEIIIIGCIELIVAVLLLGAVLKRRLRSVRVMMKTGGAERIFLKEYTKKADECCIVMQNSNRMPVYAGGNLKELLDVDLQSIQDDILSVGDKLMQLSLSKKIWKQYLEWDGSTPFIKEFQMKSGRFLEVSVSRSQNGAYDLITFRDITAFCERIDEFEKKFHEAEETSRSKTTFLSRMSHEIRTPMNGIIGMLTLADGKLDMQNPAREYLSKAGELSEHLLALINDILDMSRIEAGKVELEQKPFSLQAFGQKLYDMFAKNLESRGIRYEIRFEDMTVDHVIGDELRLSQVVVNFLSNAVKFTQQGEIIVTFKQMMLKDGAADLMIRVHDTGKGMDPEFINHIFRPFEQEGIDIAKKYGGTGLGMAITDSLVKIMGGEIIVESMPNVGSDFSVFLRFPVASKENEDSDVNADSVQTEASVDNDVFQNRRILMAEDNDLNAAIAKEILESMGAVVDIAEDGQKAVDCFASHETDYYDFILMDIQMPVMDGRQATRVIRQLDRPDASSILIFGLSADAFVEDERLSLESGMNGHFAKPVDYNLLKQNVGRFLREKEKR